MDVRSSRPLSKGRARASVPIAIGLRPHMSNHSEMQCLANCHASRDVELSDNMR
jgi:hypothetical protein